MVNLLPKTEKKNLKISYYTRIVTVLFILLSSVFFVGGALLVPSYFLSKNTAESSQRYVQALEETVGLRERDGVTDEMRALSEKTRLLREFGTTGYSSELFEEILNVKSSKVIIASIAFSGSGEVAFSLSGVSEDRASLLSFVGSLKDNQKITGVDIPVSQLAIDEDLPFSIKGVFKQ